MSAELQQVDESVLTSLLDLRREREALRLRLARMQDAAADVSEKVLARVRADYETRITALEQKALPLKDAARTSYGRLLPALERARETCEALRLDREEIDLRHSLGEWNDDEHREQLERVAADLEAAEKEAAAFAEVVTRFREAFDSPAELAPATTSQVDIPAAAPSPAPPVEPEPAASAEAPAEEDGTLLLPPEPPPAPAPPPPPAPSISEAEPPVWKPAWNQANAGGAPVEEPWKAAAEALGQSSPAPAAPAAALETHEAPTSGIPAKPASPAPESRARLEALDADLDPQPHFLEPLTFIGRTPENQVRIYKPAVSRRHAQITEGETGWMLRDLSSENGTYVNGQRVTERLLVDGDRIQFGTSRFVLRLGA